MLIYQNETTFVKHLKNIYFHLFITLIRIIIN